MKLVVFALIGMTFVDAKNGLYCSDMTCFCNDDPCDVFQCNDDKACTNSILVCESTSCPMECNGKQACKDAHIQCISDRCNLRCSADQSCYGLNSFHDTGLLTTANLEADGKAYGIWMSDRASTGKLICDGKQSCAKSDIGCAAGHCEVVCNGQQSCKESSVTTTEDSQGALVRCTEEHACQKATFDHSDTNGNVDVWCDNKQSCQDATIKCPAGHNCTVHCQGEHACQNLELECPKNMGSDKLCHIDCVGQKACQNTETSGSGDVCASCAPSAACSSELEAMDCAGEAPANCTGTWMLTVPVVGGSCDSICVGVLDMDVCRQFCTCVQDTDAPPTAAPTTAVPPVSVSPPAPTAHCPHWELKVLGLTLPLNCSSMCTGVVQDVTQCDKYCVCSEDVETEAPATPETPTPTESNCTEWTLDDAFIALPYNCSDLCTDLQDAECGTYCVCVDTAVPETNVPATNVPATNVPGPAVTLAPGLRTVLRRLIRLTLRTLMALFNRASFIRAVRVLLGSLVSSVQVHWTCPADTCTGGCSSALEKLEGGCVYVMDSTTGRSAVLLSGQEMSVEIETDAASPEAVLTAFLQEASTPSAAFAAFPVQDASIVESEVLVASTPASTTQAQASDDDSATIGLIVGVSVFAVLAVVLGVFVMSKGAKGSAKHEVVDTEPDCVNV